MNDDAVPLRCQLCRAEAACSLAEEFKKRDAEKAALEVEIARLDERVKALEKRGRRKSWLGGMLSAIAGAFIKH
jgi:hypothetical protein